MRYSQICQWRFWDLAALSKTFPLWHSMGFKSGLIRVSLQNVQRKARKKKVILYKWIFRKNKSGIWQFFDLEEKSRAKSCGQLSLLNLFVLDMSYFHLSQTLDLVPPAGWELLAGDVLTEPLNWERIQRANGTGRLSAWPCTSLHYVSSDFRGDRKYHWVGTHLCPELDATLVNYYIPGICFSFGNNSKITSNNALQCSQQDILSPFRLFMFLITDIK